MKNLTSTELNTMDKENNQARKSRRSALIILAAVPPALIGVWATACLIGLVVNYI